MQIDQILLFFEYILSFSLFKKSLFCIVYCMILYKIANESRVPFNWFLQKGRKLVLEIKFDDNNKFK